MGVALFLAKAVQWSLPELTRKRFEEYATDLLVCSYSDLIFTLGVFAVCWTLLRVTGQHGRLARVLHELLVGFGAVCVLYAIASIQVFAFLRSPLTYPLLYLAGDMRSMRSSLGSFVTPKLVAGVVLGPALYVLAVRLTERMRPLRRPVARALFMLGLVAWAVFAHEKLAGRWEDRSDHLIALSPHWELLASCFEQLGGGATEKLDLPFGREELRDFEAPSSKARARPASRVFATTPKNVLLIVLESTGARHLSVYGSRYPTTPRLAAEAKTALVFDNFYCHVGMTANSLAAISLSTFPYMTWREYTVEYPDFPGTTLADVLKARGYRTGFIHSGDLEYASQNRFLVNRGFDVIWDVHQLGPDQLLSSWGGDDRLVVDGLFRFLDEAPGQPFYAVAWTVESHHPYEPGPTHEWIDFFKGGPLPPDDYDFGRYLNTLRSVDTQIGRIFDGLRERGLADDTLVVVTGDHGEAFADPHLTWGHGARLYEESVRVPLLLWNPKLFPHGRHTDTIGSHVDVNPTVTQLLGLKPVPSWQGRSLFDSTRPPRAYFYAANDDYLLGVRDGKWKYIYDVTRGKDELYDLSKDSTEQVNLAREHRDLCRQLRRRLAAWRDHAGRQLAAVRKPAA